MNLEQREEILIEVEEELGIVGDNVTENSDRLEDNSDCRDTEKIEEEERHEMQ